MLILVTDWIFLYIVSAFKNKNKSKLNIYHIIFNDDILLIFILALKCLGHGIKWIASYLFHINYKTKLNKRITS